MAKQRKIPDVIRQLKLTRQFLGLSQERAAFQAGISQCALSLVETGESDPRLSTIMAMADLYGMELKLCDKEQS